MQCFWCDGEFDRLTDDHIVPQSLGGTLDFIVQSCEQCQTILSKAEGEVARKSILAIHALSSPVKPRHPDRPTSGNLQPVYLLVKHPFGGYGETLLSAGEKIRALPHIEIKVVPGEPIDGRVRGATAAETQLLFDLYRKTLRLDKQHAPGELVCEITANLEVGPEIAADPDFWPRLVLLPGDRLMLRGRDQEEVIRCAKVLEFVARSNYQIDPSRWNSGTQITGGTPHRIGLRWNPQCERRLAAKIGYAFFCVLAKRRLIAGNDERLRRYILGEDPSPDEPVSVAPFSTSTTIQRAAPHCAVACS
jgi:HNH endonuclease